MFNVEVLRKNGYKIRVIHRRHVWNGCGWSLVSRREAEQDNMEWNPDSKGGLSEIEVTTPTGDNYRGIAQCADMDNFNRRVAVQIALGRALKPLVKSGTLQLNTVFVEQV